MKKDEGGKVKNGYKKIINVFYLLIFSISFSCSSEIEYKYIDIVPHTVYEFSFPESEDLELTPRMIGFLDLLVVELQNNDEYNLVIFGHSDKSDSIELDKQRAQRRADNALKYLKSKGLNQERVTINNKSSEEPITNNLDENSRALNRRIGFKLTY
ncbi:MAG: OmpA family protein [Chlorobiota bacterium]